MALEVISGPLSLTLVRGLPRPAISTSSSRAKAHAADRGVHDQGQASRVKSSTMARIRNLRQGVGDEVQAPALVLPLWQRQGRACAGGALAAAPAAHHQALFPEQLLLVHADAPSLQQDAQPPVAEA